MRKGFWATCQPFERRLVNLRLLVEDHRWVPPAHRKSTSFRCLRMQRNDSADCATATPSRPNSIKYLSWNQLSSPPEPRVASPLRAAPGHLQHRAE